MKKNTHCVLRSSCILLLLSATLLVTGCQSGGRRGWGPKGEPVRAIWVTRWDYKTARDIAQVMENSKNAGFNTVLFQVRGNATAFYRSKMEPWSEELGGRDPGYDPLAVACREAHRRGMHLHAWANVVPGWRGKRPPTDRRQLYWTRPEWFWRDAMGRRQPLGWYNSVNVCYPEVRRYLVDVMKEIVAKYPVDGLHMDYVRFPNDWHNSYGLPQVPDYPRDPRTLAMFKRATGHTPESNRAAWDAWRTEQVTQLVRDIRAMMRRTSPKTCLTAAVGGSPDEAKRSHYQDARRWLAEGLLDAVYPMNYASDAKTFTHRLQTWSAMGTRVPVVTGIMFDQRDARTVVGQIKASRQHTPHFAAFAYNAMFERPAKKASHGGDGSSAARTSLRRKVVPYLRSIAGRFRLF